LSSSEVSSPFQRAYFESVGRTPVGLAYYPLLGLGLLSFVMNLPRCPLGRLLPWVGLLGLSAVQARAVPFFAVVAGPVLAWNLHDSVAGVMRVPKWQVPQRRLGQLVGPPLALILGAVLLVSAWTRWLKEPPYGPPRWAIEQSPSVEHGIATVNHWRQEGKLSSETRWLHLSRETAAAFAW